MKRTAILLFLTTVLSARVDAQGTPTLRGAPPAIGLTRNASVPTRSDAPHPGTVTEKLDRFTSLTDVKLDGVQLQPELEFAGFYSMKGGVLPTVVTLAFFRSGKEWEYLRCHTVAMLADGQPVAVSEAKHTGNVRNGVTEFITFEIATRAFLEAVNSAKVEVRLCNSEFTLTLPQLTAFRDFASRMQK